MARVLLVLSYVKPFKPTKEFCYMFSAGSTRLLSTPLPVSQRSYITIIKIHLPLSSAYIFSYWLENMASLASANQDKSSILFFLISNYGSLLNQYINWKMGLQLDCFKRTFSQPRLWQAFPTKLKYLHTSRFHWSFSLDEISLKPGALRHLILGSKVNF